MMKIVVSALSIFGIILTVGLIAIICAVNIGNKQRSNINKSDYYDESRKWQYSIVVMDGCQYVQWANYRSAHKGNCTNSIHVYNK